MDREATEVKELTTWEKARKLMNISFFVFNVYLAFFYILIFRNMTIKEHAFNLAVLGFLLFAMYFTIGVSARIIKIDKRRIIYLITALTILMCAGPFIPGDTNGYEDIIIYLASPWAFLAGIGLICDTVEIIWLIFKKQTLWDD